MNGYKIIDQRFFVRNYALVISPDQEGFETAPYPMKTSTRRPRPQRWN